MNRRGFFGLLGAVTVGSVGRADAQLTAPPTVPPEPDSTCVRGYPSPSSPRTGGGGAYRYHWTGLKSGFENSYLVGQWLAWPTPNRNGTYAYNPDHEPPYLYVNVPGFVGGVYHPGHSFNIASRERFIIPGTSEDQIHAWIGEGERYLVKLMNAYCDRTAAQTPTLSGDLSLPHPLTHATL